MLGRCCEVTGAYTFKGLAEKAFGRNAGIAIQCVVLSYTTGTCIAYVIFAGEFCRDFFAYCAYKSGNVDNTTIADAAPVFTGAYHYLTDPIYSKVGLALFVLLPICLVRDLHMLRHTSTLAVICIMYTTGKEECCMPLLVPTPWCDSHLLSQLPAFSQVRSGPFPLN